MGAGCESAAAPPTQRGPTSAWSAIPPCGTPDPEPGHTPSPRTQRRAVGPVPALRATGTCADPCPSGQAPLTPSFLTKPLASPLLTGPCRKAVLPSPESPCCPAEGAAWGLLPEGPSGCGSAAAQQEDLAPGHTAIRGTLSPGLVSGATATAERTKGQELPRKVPLARASHTAYLRVHTCSGAEARLSVGCPCPLSPLRAVAQMVYLLPGSRALRERGGWSRGPSRPALLPDRGRS